VARGKRDNDNLQCRWCL